MRDTGIENIPIVFGTFKCSPTERWTTDIEKLDVEFVLQREPRETMSK